MNNRFISLLLGMALCSNVFAETTAEAIDPMATETQGAAISTEATEASMSEVAMEQMTFAETNNESLTSIMVQNAPKINAPKAGAFSLSKEAYTKYGGYLPLKEFEITPIPLISFGFIAKGNKKNFRAARNNFIPSYENHLDDWSQHFPLILTTALNFAGYEGRNNHWRYLTSGALSYATMAAIVNGIKYSAKEMRPDGSTANSFPSGHTATAFVAATILHKEYGQTRSPWFSVAGYGCATMTGIMRTLNNRHWISDILVGAGLGVLSTDIGYAIADMIWKDKGINRQQIEGMGDMIANPSFFRFSLGMQFMNDLKLPNNIEYITTAQLWSKPGEATLMDDFYMIRRHGNPFRIPDDFNEEVPSYKNYATGQPSYAADVMPRVKVATGTSVSAEGAYFINNYLGFGARARITTAPTYADGLYCYKTVADNKMMKIANSGSVSEVWSIVDAGIGIFGGLPISKHHNIGAKLLYGRRFFGELDLSAAYDAVYSDGTNSVVATTYGDNLWIGKTNTDDFGAGIHYTYSTNNGIAVSAYVDYDFSNPEFYVEYSPYNNDANKMHMKTSEFKYKQRMQSFNIGASMVVMF